MKAEAALLVKVLTVQAVPPSPSEPHISPQQAAVSRRLYHEHPVVLQQGQAWVVILMLTFLDRCSVGTCI